MAFQLTGMVLIRVSLAEVGCVWEQVSNNLQMECYKHIYKN